VAAAASERPVALPLAKWHIRGSWPADGFIICSIRVQFSGSPRPSVRRHPPQTFTTITTVTSWIVRVAPRYRQIGKEDVYFYFSISFRSPPFSPHNVCREVRRRVRPGGRGRIRGRFADVAVRGSAAATSAAARPTGR